MVDSLIFTDSHYYGFGRSAGAYQVASQLRAENLSCQVVEFFLRLSPDEMEEIVDQYVGNDTLFVGFSTTLLQFNRHVVLDELPLYDICKREKGSIPKTVAAWQKIVKTIKANPVLEYK